MGKFECYRDRAGLWRWHLKASNGRIIADSGQGYQTARDCVDGVFLVKKYAPDAEVVSA